MRGFLAVVCVLGLAACAYLGAETQDGQTNVRLRLVDAAGGQNVGGMMRVWAGEKPLDLPGLFPRLRGVQPPAGCQGWFVLPAGGAEVSLPRGELRLEALSGLETARRELDLDLRKNLSEEITIKLDPVFAPEIMASSPATRTCI